MTERLAAQMDREEQQATARRASALQQEERARTKAAARPSGERRKASVVSADIGFDGMIIHEELHSSKAARKPPSPRQPPTGPPLSPGRQQVEEARRLEKEKTKHFKPRGYLGDGEGLSFCVDTIACEDPYYEGILLPTWNAHHGQRGYRVAGEIALGVPNDGSSVARNHGHVEGSILLLERGGVTFLTKARNAQAAGAIAVIVADQGGQCGEEFACGGAVGTRSLGQGLAYSDSRSEWAAIKIPVVMISKGSYERIKAQIQPLVHTIQTEEFGLQTVMDS
jgi:PA domain